MGSALLIPQLKGVVGFPGTALNATQADLFPITITANTTLTITSGAYVGQVVTVVIQQNATGGFSVTWPALVDGAPNVKQAANAVTTVQLTWNGARWLVLNQPIIVQTAYVNATTGMTSVPDLGWSIGVSGQLHGLLGIVWQQNTGNDGIQYQITGPTIGAGSLTFSVLSTGTVGGGASGLTAVNKVATAFASALSNSLTTITGTTNFLDIIQFSVIAGATGGTIQLQAAATVGGQVTIAAGSWGQVWAI